MAFILQPFDRLQDLFDLICLGLALGVLNVDPRVTLPWGLVDPVARTFLAGLPEVVVADSTGVRKPDAPRVLVHLSDYVVNSRHNGIVSLLIYSSSSNRDRESPRGLSPPTTPGIRITYQGVSVTRLHEARVIPAQRNIES